MSIRKIRVEGAIAFIPLTKGYEAIIDAADAPLVCGHNWRASVRPHTVYVVRERKAGDTIKTQQIRLHRDLMGVGGVDHINGSGLDNRRCNLRIATISQNNQNRRIQRNNTSGCKGVVWVAKRNAWNVRIKINCKRKYLGEFPAFNDAKAAYEKANAEIHGEFGRLK